MTCESIDLGEFIVGEKPAPLTYQFLTAAGTAINITGWDAVFTVREKWGTAQELTANVTAGPAGKVTRTWDGTEFPTPGEYEAVFWVGNGTNRFASTPIAWVARASVGSIPAI